MSAETVTKRMAIMFKVRVVSYIGGNTLALLAPAILRGKWAKREAFSGAPEIRTRLF
jgi:hypothetical protein